MYKVRTRGLMAVTAGAALGLGLVGCSGGDDPDTASPSGSASGSADCADFEQYGDLSGKTVSVYTSIVAPEADQQTASYKPFEECTGAKIAYEGSREFEAQLPVRLKAGNPPDIAYVPQPGFLKSMVADYPDAVVAAPQETIDNANKYYSEDWVNYGTVDGTLYATPLGSNVKSFVWYSPQAFEDNGYTVPKTWDDLMALTEKIKTDHPDAKPWCAGIESGEATGWPATDWLEDVVLRTAGADVYDQWVNHEIPFNDPQILTALQTVGSILKDPANVNGGLGEVQSIATTAWNEAGNPILDGSCFLHRAANFYQANWDEGVKVQEEPTDDGVYAFYLPGKSETDKPLLGGGEFVTGFADRPEVAAFRTYLASPQWADAKAAATGQGWISANNGFDESLLKSPIDQLSFQLLTDESYTFRFDGSDQMPGAVGADAFWKQMTAWIGENQADQATLDNIEKAWPAS
jgi:alpha-glucoside transport system substrate-binding protein